MITHAISLFRVGSEAFSASTTTTTTTTTHRTTFQLNIDEERMKGSITNKNKQRKFIEYDNNSHLKFDYEYNELKINNNGGSGNNVMNIVLLIHPIGVGIGRWYYNRLLKEIGNTSGNNTNDDNDASNDILQTKNLICLAPDLLGCGSACDPKLITIMKNNNDIHTITLDKLPLFLVNDWADQIVDFMIQYEAELKLKNDEKNDDGNNERFDNIHWSVVSNGGCVPIALEIGKRFVESQTISQTQEKEKNTNHNSCHPLPSSSSSSLPEVTNLILSATPSAESLFSKPDIEKVQKSYKTLSGVPGSLFWWYSLRSNGKFIQSFSEKNLAARAENLGSDWTPLCVETASSYGGKSRYSTFAFLAGSLNGGNDERLKSLSGIIHNNSSKSKGDENDNEKVMNIDIITGRDNRRNRARSWFWEKESKGQKETVVIEKTTLVPIIEQNGNGGTEHFVGGRRCPAHEDALGFSRVLLEIIFREAET